MSGSHKGKAGKVLRVVATKLDGRTLTTVLVSFPGGAADYIEAAQLEKQEGGKK